MALNAEIADRLRKYLDQKTLSASKLEEISGLSHGTLSKFLQGNQQMRMDTVEKLISSPERINPSWLLLGIPPMTLPGGKSGKNLPLKPKETSALSQAKMSRVQYFPHRIAAGAETGLSDINHEDMPELVIPGIGNDGPYIALSVIGDSMAPTIQEGDIVICRKATAEPVRDNSVYVVELIDDGAVVKRVADRRSKTGEFVLRSDNKSYDLKRVNAERVRNLWYVVRLITGNLSGPDSLYNRVSQLEGMVLDVYDRLNLPKPDTGIA